MSLEKFEICVGLILVILLTIWLAPSRNFPHGYNIKKIKLKYFGFLFNEGIGDFRKPKEISLQIFLFQLIGYIINILHKIFGSYIMNSASAMYYYNNISCDNIQQRQRL